MRKAENRGDLGAKGIFVCRDQRFFVVRYGTMLISNSEDDLIPKRGGKEGEISAMEGIKSVGRSNGGRGLVAKKIYNQSK